MGRANWTFEEKWSHALDVAETSPPPQIWVAIDAQLANEKAIGYKKQAEIYKWVAAACLFFLAISSVIYWFNSPGSSKYELADHSKEMLEVESNDGEALHVTVLDDEDEEESNTAAESQSRMSSDLIIKPQPVQSIESKGKIPITSTVHESKVKRDESLPNSELEWIVLAPKSTALPSSVEPWETQELFGVPRTWERISEDKYVSPLWAGVSFSTGAFDPGFEGGEDLVFASSEVLSYNEVVADVNAPSTAQYSSGQSVAGGVNIGKRINRFVLSSGLQYSAFNTGSINSQVASDVQNDSRFALTSETADSNLENALSEGNLRYSGEDVRLANEYEYLTVPIKAGYILLDRKFNITLNTGLSSNILIDSNLVSSGESESLNNDFKTTHNYESVYFNFLTSVEFGYVFKRHYQFLLEPNYNQALTNFTRSDFTDQAKPKNIGVSVGFRYNF